MHAAEILWDLIRLNLDADADRVALISEEEVVTYAALARRAEAIAGGLYALGVRPGDVVAIHLLKSIDEAIAQFAVQRLGAVHAGVYDRCTEAQLRRTIRDYRAVALSAEPRRAAALADRPEPSLRAVIARGPSGDLPRLDALSGEAPPCPARPGALAALFTTSGSTGLPKGVMHCHEGLLTCGRNVATYLRYQPDERPLGLSPFSFHYGFSQMTSAFSVGGSVAVPKVTLPPEVLRTIEALGATGLAGVPMTWASLVGAQEEVPRALPTFRYLTSGGGKMDEGLLERLPRAFPHTRIHLLYGMTEALRSTHLPPERYPEKTGAMGLPVPGVEVYVVNDRGDLCGPGEVGELVHRGAHIALGYWDRPEASAEKFRPCPALGLGDERVCFSGDLVWRDEDDVLWFKSRADELIKTSGFRVGPQEIEEAALGSGLVELVVAFGGPDPLLGQVVEVIVTTPGDAPLDATALRRHCRRALPTYMVPRRIHHWTGPLPTTATGKPRRSAMVEAKRADRLE